MNQEDFIQLFKNYRRKLINFLYYKCGNIELSEDIVHEVFLSLWEKRAVIKSDHIVSYLYTMANNHFIDHYRRQKVEITLFDNNPVNSSVESPEYLLEFNEFNNSLKRAIGSLSEKERIVFLMNRIDGLTFNEIAKSFEISVKTVEKRMHNAVEKLYKKINRKL